MKKINLLCAFLLGSGAFALAACRNDAPAASSEETPSSSDISSEIPEASSEDTTPSSEEPSSEEPVPSSEESSSEAPSSEESSSEEAKTVYGNWKGDLIGYDYEGEPNYDDLSNAEIVINEDLSGSYAGVSVTWTYMSTGVLAGRYRYFNDDYQVHFAYNEEADTIDVKWEDQLEGNYRTGTFERDA